MAVLDTIFDRGIAEALGRRLGLGDTGLTLMPELAATLQLESMPEMFFHMGWRRYMASASTPAGGAATFVTMRFRMPRTVNIIAVIENVYFGVVSATTTEIRVTGINATADLAVAAAPQVRDNIHASAGSCLISHTTGADLLNGGGGIFSNAQNATPAIFPLVVRPARQPGLNLDGYDFQVAVANQTFEWCITWRERIVNDQENAP